MTLRVILAVLAMAWSAPAAAHNSPPALLQFSPLAGGLAIEFRVPRLDGMLPSLDVVLPPSLVDIAPPSRVELPDAELRRRMVAGTAAALAGERVAFPGLELTGIDVLVRAGGPRPWTAVARATTPYVICPWDGSKLGAAATFAGQGVRHILFGPDHLLFVLGLLLLVRNRRALMLTITTFTVAHSITLALATYGVALPPTTLVNALIGLSILYLAVEIAATRDGSTTGLAKRPWRAAFAFGLLHGFGFASALTEAGLPRTDLAIALVAFNVGIEAGQLGVVALAWVLATGFDNLAFAPRRWSRTWPAYAVGVPGAFWTLDRGLAALGILT